MSYQRETEAIRNGKLLVKAVTGTLTLDEQAEFDAWLSVDGHSELYDSIREGESLKEQLVHFDRYDEHIAYPKLMARRTTPQSSKYTRFLKWLPYAAAVLIAVTAAGYIFFSSALWQQPTDSILAAADIAPGGNRATLTLGDGRTIALDQAKEGIIMTDGRITYNDGSTPVVMLNESKPVTDLFVLTTPKGGTYHITLPDGSRVWLNAESTLKYPSRFDGSDRVVELTGEAYFSITSLHKERDVSNKSSKTHSERVPFRVISAGHSVEVLGTEFNISAYPDEPEVKTTLVEGAVKIASIGVDQWKPVVLEPGQLAIASNGLIEIKQVDVLQYTAWKDGRFYFDQTSFEDLMRQISRWYNVAVVYEHTIPKETFSGEMSRNLTLASVLKLLNVSAVQVQIEEGNRVRVR